LASVSPALARRIAQANIDALTNAGAFKVTVPRRFGGYEMTIRETLEVSAGSWPE
jgi:3-hydroxy-9,10-secoandrosta-1,3,5(10)-triene-9,17-dione monooxygenase